MEKTKNILLASDSLKPCASGITRVGRLMGKLLLEQSKDNNIDVKALIYSDSSVTKDIDLRQQLAKGSKLKFLYANYINAINRNFFIYNFPGISRAHCIVPGFRKPWMTWIHGIEVWENARPIYAKLAKRATIILSNSSYTLKRAEGIHGPFSNARVCWLGTETDLQSSLDPPSDNNTTVTIISRIDKQTYKGHYPLIACWPDVVAKVPSAQLQIVGEGPGKPELQRTAENTSAAHHIVFQGFVSDEQIEKIWKQTTLLAMPSRGEGFGLVYIEAMRHGRPVIASIHDAASEINIDGHTGFNVDLDVPGQLASRIVDLLTDHNKVIEMGINGKRRWKQHFCYSAFKRRFLPIFNDFIQ